MNELLNGPQFSLYDAMSALELMDPKMDGVQEPTIDVSTRLATGTKETTTKRLMVRIAPPLTRRALSARVPNAVASRSAPFRREYR